MDEVEESLSFSWGGWTKPRAKRFDGSASHDLDLSAPVNVQVGQIRVAITPP